MKKKLICVVGAGGWGINHIKTLYRKNNLGAVVEINKDRIAHINENFPDVKVFNNLDDSFLYSFAGYIVATPPKSHFSITKKIIENGNHVLVEKPITLNSNHAEELHKISIKHNVNLMVGHVLLFHPAFEKMKKFIDNGLIGDLQYLYSNRLNLGKIRSEENVFWSFAPHDIALFQWIIGTYPTKLESNGAIILQENIHDTSITSLEYKNNIMGHIYVSWLHPFKEHRFVVIGSKGMLSFEDSAKGKPLTFYDKTVLWEDGMPKASSGNMEIINYDKELPLDRELNYFIEHLDGRPLNKCNGQSAIEIINILESSSKKLMDKNS